MANLPMSRLSPCPAPTGDGNGFVTRDEFYNFVNQLATQLSGQLASIDENTKKTSDYVREQNGRLATAITNIAVLQTKLDTVEEVRDTVQDINNNGCRAGRAVHLGAPPPPVQAWGAKKTAAISGISGASIMAAVIKLIEWIGSVGK